MRENLKNLMDKAGGFILKHAGFFCILTLILFCYLFLFLNLGSYRLIDAYEARYLNIARAMLFNNDFVTLNLNFEKFLQNPPMFGWLCAISYKLTGLENAFTTRLPAALLCALTVFATYFFGKKATGSKVFGLISSLILLSCALTTFFARLATPDICYMTFMTLAMYCAVITLFYIKEENKKYFIWLSFLFLGLCVLQKGFSGILIPVLSIIFTFIAAQHKGKELIKPSNIIPGIIIFLLVTLPWHILAYRANGTLWLEEYFVKYHIAEFLNSSLSKNSSKPFLFYVPVILAGFMPWAFSFISALIRGIKSLIKDYKSVKSVRQMFSGDTADRKILVFASISFIVTLIFLSIKETKTTSCALLLVPSISLITGYYWWGYISDGKFEKGIKISSMVASVFFIVFGFTLAIVPAIFPSLADFRVLIASWLIVMALISILCIMAKNRALLFVSYVILMTGLSIILSAKVLDHIVSFDQAELEKYAAKAASVSGAKLVTVGFDDTYCLSGNYEKKIIFIKNPDNEGYNRLKSVSDKAEKTGNAVYLIVKKGKSYPPEILKHFKKVNDGQKYDLYVK